MKHNFGVAIRYWVQLKKGTAPGHRNALIGVGQNTLRVAQQFILNKSRRTCGNEEAVQRPQSYRL